MVAKIIAACHQKGGAGKSTLTMQIAGTIGRKNRYKVLVVDADPQGTSTVWSSSALEGNPFPAQVAGLGAAGSRVHKEIQKYQNDFDFILIDCPPAVDSLVPQSALLVANLVIVPCIPSPPDIWAAQGIVRLIESLAVLNEGLISRLIINQQQNGTLLSREVELLLKEFGIEIAKSRLSQREVYRQSALYGSTVHHFSPRAKEAVTEIESLTNELCSILGVTL